MADPILYGPAYSTYVRSCRLALEEKGQAYDFVEIDMFGGAHKEPEFLARHPFGKVPAFEHDGFPLYESGAILRYVDEVFAGPRLQPEDAHARARMNQAISIADNYAYTSMIFPIVVERLDKSSIDEAAIAEALPQARTSLAAFASLLGDRDFLAGEAPGLADLHLVPIYDYFAQTPEGETLLAEVPTLRRWWERMNARPSVVKTRPDPG